MLELGPDYGGIFDGGLPEDWRDYFLVHSRGESIGKTSDLVPGNAS
jgi:hypothetical protein